MVRKILSNENLAGYSELNAITPPAAPAAGAVRLFAAQRASRVLPMWIGPAGLIQPIQPAMFDNAVYWWSPTTVTAGLWIGTVGAGAGTFATALPTTTNLYTVIRRSTYKTVITTANQQVGQRGTENIFFRGASAGQGGFFLFCRFGLENWTAGDRLYIGMTAAGAAIVTVQPSSLLNSVGFGIDAADSAITFMSNDGVGAATKTAIAGQPALAANQGYDAYIFCKPNDSTIYFRLDNLNTGANIIDSSVAADLPVNTTMLAPSAVMGNAANTPVNAAGLGIADIYVETDR